LYSKLCGSALINCDIFQTFLLIFNTKLFNTQQATAKIFWIQNHDNICQSQCRSVPLSSIFTKIFYFLHVL